MSADNTIDLQEADAEAEMQNDVDYSYYPHHINQHDGYMEPLEKRSASRFSSTPADLASGAASPQPQEDLQVRISNPAGITN